MAEYLESSDDTGSSGAKFVLKCGDITTETPTTSGWLDSITALHSYKSKMAHLVCIPYMVNIFFNE
jgi:hypothetical protein